MGKMLLQMMIAAYVGWTCWNPVWLDEALDTAEWGQEQPEWEDAGYSVGQVSPRDTDPASQGYSRGMFSAYVVGGLNCMDDGNYEAYVKSLKENPDTRRKHEDQDRTDTFPKIYLRFMGLDLTDYIDPREPEGGVTRHKAFCSDAFYMEYPLDWYVGSTDACTLTFVPEWEKEASTGVIQDWAEYVDDRLQGSTQEVQAFIEEGGINGYLEEVTGKPVTEAYTWELREDNSEWLLIYDLMKGEKQAAEIIVWCNLGKCNIRNWDVELTVDPEKDYGRILVFQEWNTFDFSSEAAIREYVESEDFLYRLLGQALEDDVKNRIISLNPGTFRTAYHDFFTVVVGIHPKDNPEKLLRQASVYIPVTRPEQYNWVVVFETFPGTRQEKGIGNQKVRQQVISTFVSLPYYHQVQKGENLSQIAMEYGEDPNLAYEIASYIPNQIQNPDRIWPGQQIEIPLGVLFRRVHHEF